MTDFIMSAFVVAAMLFGTFSAFAQGIGGTNTSEGPPQHTLAPLPYSYDALEPFIDAQTMKLHHSAHHQAYVNNLNAALAKAGEEFQRMDLVTLMRNLDKLPESVATAIRNNGGGHYNHTLFWTLMGKDTAAGPSGKLLEAINRDFGSLDAFKEAFKAAALGQFGSGWAFLLPDKEGKLKIKAMPNQDNPLMSGCAEPILAVDVWEHAYYLKYQNRRGEYVDNFWKVVNWKEVERRFEAHTN